MVIPREFNVTRNAHVHILPRACQQCINSPTEAAMRVEYKVTVPSGEQSMEPLQTIHLEGKTTTTYHVQFVVLPSEVNY